jgi:hypothetical protein
MLIKKEKKRSTCNENLPRPTTNCTLFHEMRDDCCSTVLDWRIRITHLTLKVLNSEKSQTEFILMTTEGALGEHKLFGYRTILNFRFI